ncbi:MAG: extracellular solute-binding protein [Oscillospiraceae bacterium]|nr:extracellular solute-binding protein [Oscillospiraceae bacterium]
MKKLLALTLASLLLLAFAAGCVSASPSAGTPGGNTNTDGSGSQPGGETVDLLVWGPQEGMEFLNKAIEEFKNAHPENTYNITTAIVNEGDAKSRLLEDPEAGADVFAFADDQLRDLVGAGALYEITRNAGDIKSRNVSTAVDICTLDGKLMAYPQTGDNGYFLYYDKSVISAEDAKTLDAILARCNDTGMKFIYAVNEAWITASWFLAQGTLGLGDDGKQIVDFNNANGLAAAEAMIAMVNSGAWVTGWNEVMTDSMGDTIAAGVSGTWMANDMITKLGDNYAATKLPTATIGGRQVQLSSFFGGKLVGVNSQSKVAVHAMDFADFLTGETMQALNFEMRGIGPTNIKVADSADVKANIALAAFAEQAKYAYPQRDVQGSYWDAVGAFGSEVVNGITGSPQSLLDEMVAQIME